MSQETPSASASENRIPSVPPPSAIHFTRIRSGIEKSTPMENISSTTPTSANTSNVWRSERCGPGVNGLMTMPPKTKPRMSGSLRRQATSPPKTAARKIYVKSRNRTGLASMGPRRVIRAGQIYLAGGEAAIAKSKSATEAQRHRGKRKEAKRRRGREEGEGATDWNILCR